MQTTLDHPSLGQPALPAQPPPTKDETAQPTKILDRIITLREVVGDDLSDTEFSCFLAHTQFEDEAGFTFLGYNHGCALFKGPPQDCEKWCGPNGWTAPEKQTVARRIAEKYHLRLYEPPDVVSNYKATDATAKPCSHHLNFCGHKETLIIAHPLYLKVRLYADQSGSCTHRRESLLPGPDLLQDLSTLYSDKK